MLADATVCDWEPCVTVDLLDQSRHGSMVVYSDGSRLSPSCHAGGEQILKLMIYFTYWAITLAFFCLPTFEIFEQKASGSASVAMLTGSVEGVSLRATLDGRSTASKNCHLRSRE